MKTSRTPKIVIGVSLVAVYSAILAALILRDGHHDTVAANPPSEPPAFVEPSASDPALSEAAAPAPTELVASSPEQLAAAPVPAAPVEHGVSKQVAVRESRPIGTDTARVASEPVAPSASSAAPLAAQASDAPVDTDSKITPEVKSEAAAVEPADNDDGATEGGVVAQTLGN